MTYAIEYSVSSLPGLASGVRPCPVPRLAVLVRRTFIQLILKQNSGMFLLFLPFF